MTLNTAIRGEQIQPATISGGHLNFSNTLGSGIQVVAYDSNEAAFKWQELPTITINEIPSGDIDGSNTEFTLSNTPLDDSVRVYLNGLLQEPGSGNDYTVSGNKITFSIAPESGDILLVSYLIDRYSNSAGYSGPGYGYSCGGYDGNVLIKINRITFPFNSGIASVVGNLSSSRNKGVGCNSSSNGYSCGGTDTVATVISIIDRFQFPFDSGTTSNVGNLSGKRANESGCNSSTYGYILTGYDSDISNYVSIIDRIQFPFDSGTASNIGNLSFVNSYSTACNSSIYGYSIGGHSSSYTSNIDRFQFPFNSGTTSTVGNLSGSRSNMGGCNSSNYGYSIGGTDSAHNRYSTIDRVQFPFDSGIASHVGDLSGSRRYNNACNSTTYAYSFGGQDNSGYISNIDRFQFPFDSGTSSHIGDLNGSKVYVIVCDNTDFVSMFV